MTTGLRVTLPEVEDLTPEQAAVYERFRSNLTRSLLLTKGSAGPHLALGASFTTGLLPLLEREVVVLRVAALRDSELERAIHLPLARRAGMTEDEIEAVEQGRYDEMPDDRAAVVRYVSECTEQHAASAEAFDALLRHRTQNEIAEITHLAGHAMLTAMYVASLGVPPDEQAASWNRLTELQRG